MANLPIRRYDGAVRLIASSRELDEALEALRRETLLGFDTETRPSFHKGQRYPPALAQLAGTHAVWIFPLQRLDCSAPLRELLEAAHIVKAGVGIGDDLRQLKQLFPFAQAGVVDIGTLAKGRGIEQTGLRNLAGLVLGYRVPKGSRTSNWASPRLTPQQIRYAAMDAWVARELYLRMAL